MKATLLTRLGAVALVTVTGFAGVAAPSRYSTSMEAALTEDLREMRGPFLLDTTGGRMRAMWPLSELGGWPCPSLQTELQRRTSAAGSDEHPGDVDRMPVEAGPAAARCSREY